MQVGDCYIVESGANQHGAGRQVAVVERINKKGDAYCKKYNRNTLKCIAKNYKLEPDKIVTTWKSLQDLERHNERYNR